MRNSFVFYLPFKNFEQMYILMCLYLFNSLAIVSYVHDCSGCSHRTEILYIEVGKYLKCQCKKSFSKQHLIVHKHGKS